MDGVYDMENSVIHTDFSLIKTEYTWVKMTVGSFRTTDVVSIYSDMGFEVKPMLVVRDVRFAFSSLIRKIYGINGNTAEDPPLRLRYRRFLEDWQVFRDKGWPILVYEKFVQDPEVELRKLTESMSLPWHDSMLDWPKSEDAISYLSPGNETFLQSRGKNQGLKEALMSNKANFTENMIAEKDLTWLEDTFHQFNVENGYPEHIENISMNCPDSRIPQAEATTRKNILKTIKEINEKYWNAKSKLDRIRGHIVFNTLIRLWSRYVNRNFRVLE